MIVIILDSVNNELLKMEFATQEIKFDGSDKVHNNLLAEIINQKADNRGLGKLNLTCEDVKEMLKNQNRENDTIYLYLPGRFSCPMRFD